MKIQNLKDITEQKSSHNDIMKKVFLEKGVIPNLMQFAASTFKPGEASNLHSHDTMFEAFFILSGKAVFNINGKDHQVEKDDFISIEPKEIHAQSNPFNEEVTWVYFGIAIE